MMAKIKQQYNRVVIDKVEEMYEVILREDRYVKRS